jgi:hypothetical protein
LPSKFSALYPTPCVVPAAVGVLVPYIIDFLSEAVFGSSPFHRVSEVQELYMYLFVFLYLLDLRNREIS